MSDSDGAYYALYLQEKQENKELKARIKELEKMLDEALKK